VSLAVAREKVQAARKLLGQDIDPIDQRDAARQAAEEQEAPAKTFAHVADVLVLDFRSEGTGPRDKVADAIVGTGFTPSASRSSVWEWWHSLAAIDREVQLLRNEPPIVPTRGERLRLPSGIALVVPDQVPDRAEDHESRPGDKRYLLPKRHPLTGRQFARFVWIIVARWHWLVRFGLLPEIIGVAGGWGRGCTSMNGCDI